MIVGTFVNGIKEKDIPAHWTPRYKRGREVAFLDTKMLQDR
jgi:hypothetical protein